MTSEAVRRIDVVSIFPDYLEPLRLSLVGKAVQTGLVDLRVHDLRNWTHDRHRTVDDTPYGGGAGMVMRPEPWGEALDSLYPEPSPERVEGPLPERVEGPLPEPVEGPRLVLLTPSGRTFTQTVAHELAAEPWLIFACGRYEGIDARVVEHAARRMRVDEISIGDYVLNGGEAAALVVIEAIVRLLPGVIGNPDSLTEESHAVGQGGLLEYPVYTKPPSWRGHDVPEILFSGHHAKIAAWRREQAVAKTRSRRPDLLPLDQQQLVIEPAQPADAGELLTLERGAYLTEGRAHRDWNIPPLTETLDELREAISAAPFLLARLGSRVVGSVRGQLVDGDVWYIGRLMVAPDLQGRGFGGFLLATIEGLAPSQATRYRLTTGANSTHNLAFYARRGYREVGRRAAPGEVALVTLEKPIGATPDAEPT